MIANAFDLLTQPTVERLGWTLIHFVWQGVFVWACLAMLLWRMKNRTAQARYLASCAALLLLVALPVCTYVAVRVDVAGSNHLAEVEPGNVSSSLISTESASQAIRPVYTARTQRPGAIEVEPNEAIDEFYIEVEGSSEAAWRTPEATNGLVSDDDIAQVPSRTESRYATFLTGSLPWFVVTWFAGVLCLSIWHILGWSLSQRLRHQATDDVPARVKRVVQRLCRRLRISRVVGIRLCAWTTAPMQVGWLKPIVLTPACVLTGLSSSELEAVLIHELAHIRRHDYLVNLCQTAIETLLFYHPAVWWVSRQIRIEREYCADDYATRISDGADVYARALASLGLLSQTSPRYAVASTGPTLVTRIRRVLGLPVAAEPRRFRRLSHASGATGLFVAAGLAACFAATAERPQVDGRPSVESGGEVGRPAPNAEPGRPAPNAELRVPAASADEKMATPRTDLYGDPLPVGAIARIGSIRLRHTETVQYVAYSPNGELIASAGRDGIRLWETTSARPRGWWPGRCDHLAFSPDGNEIACAGDSEIWILDVSTGEEARRFAVENIRGVVYAPDGSFLVGWGGTFSTRNRKVVRSEGFARLLDPKTGEVLREFEGHEGRIFSAALSPDGSTLATSSQDNTIRLWETASGTELRQTPILDEAQLEQGKWLRYDITAQLAFSPAEQMLAVAMPIVAKPEYSIRLWETPSGKELRRLGHHDDKIQSLAFSKDGRYLVSGGRDKKVRVWETQFGQSMAVYSHRGHTGWIECVAFSPDYQTVVSGSQDQTVRIWHLPAGGQLHPRVANKQRIRGASLSPDGKWFATGGRDGVRIWEAKTGRSLSVTYPPKSVDCVAFSPDGRSLVSGSGEHGIRLWELKEWNDRVFLKEPRRLQGYNVPAVDVAFSPDGTRLVSGGGDSDRTVRLWDVASRKEIRQWTTGPDSAEDVAFSSDGRRVAALCGDDALRIWNTETGHLVQQIDKDRLTFRGAHCIAFSPDSRTLVTGGKGENCVFRDGRRLPPPSSITVPSAIRFWDVATGEMIRELSRDPRTLLEPGEQEGSHCVGREVHAIAISPDGRLLASAEKDLRVLLFDIESARLLADFKGHESHVTALEFSSDGTRLVSTCGDDLTALVWDVTPFLGEKTERPAVPKTAPPPAADREDDEKPAVESRVAANDEGPSDETASQRAADLAPPVRITAGGAPIDVEGFAAPFVGDFDEDGKNDLLVGQLQAGRLRIYRNVGTNARPKFDGFEWFTTVGGIAGVPICCRVAFTPQLVDFDGDGRTDILTGAGWGEVYLFRRNQDGSFAEAEILEDKHGELQMGRYFPNNSRIRYNSTAFAHDWDDDGDLDLLFGRSARCLVPNEGSRRQPVFGDGLPLEFEGEVIPSGIVGPCAADWDGDGRDDLLVGRKGDIVWYRNTGKKGRPVLQGPEILIPAGNRSPGNERRYDEPAYHHAICVADFNADGRLDLLLGDHSVRRIELTEEQRAQLAEASAKNVALRGEVTRRPQNETQQERIERFRIALREWQECASPLSGSAQAASAQYARHGCVWLYERTGPQE